MQILSYVIKSDENNKLLKDILRNKMNISDNLSIRLKAKRNVLINGRTGYYAKPVRTGDLVTVNLYFPEETKVQAENIPLNILFENDDFLAINKPPDMPTHPTSGHQRGTLANAVCYYFKQKNLKTCFRPSGRLDKDTSGIVLIGKNQYGHGNIAIQMQNNLVEKEYVALVNGKVIPEKGSIELPISRLSPDSMLRIVSPDGQFAKTKYEVIASTDKASLVKIILETGRTHQIRVHFSHIGHPLLGDTWYGGNTEYIARQALHASKISFIDPRTGEKITLQAPYPSDILDAWEKINTGRR